MSTKAALRRRVAGLTAFAVVGATLALLPFNVSTANATTVPPQSTLMGLINEDRVLGSGDPIFQDNGFLDDYAQAKAADYAACSGCGNPASPDWILGTETEYSQYLQTVSGGSVSSQILRALTDFETYDASDTFGSNQFGAVGFVTKGSTSYVVLITASWATTPTNETRNGTVKLPSTIRVGQAISPTITGFSPLPNPDYVYKWFDGSTVVSTIRNYVPTVNELGHTLRLTVEDHNTGYSDSVVSSATSSKVQLGVPTTPSSISVTGLRNVGQTLTVSLAGFLPHTPSPQWYRNGVAIVGATSNTYLQVAGDRGKKISVKLTEAQNGYTTAVKSSSTSIVTGWPLLISAYPYITGTPTFGNTLTANAGVWGPGAVKLSYQWRADGAVIKGATHSTLVLGTAQLNTSISVTVTGSESGYTTAAHTSPGTSDVHMLLFSSTSTPSIIGVASPGHTLTAVVSTWTPAATMYVYQWYLNSVAISGATGKTYKLPSSAAFKTITVQVIGFRPDYQPMRYMSSGVAVS